MRVPMASILMFFAVLFQSLISVHWASWQKGAVVIYAGEFESAVDECLASSREARIRFEAKLCRRRTGWFNACAEMRTEVHSIAFDPVTESFKVVSDRHSDESDPVSIAIPSKQEAMRAMLQVDNLDLDFLARHDVKLLNSPRRYLEVRSVFTCKGSMSKTIGRLAQILTLGLVNVIETDSGWLEFDIDEDLKISDEANDAGRR